MMEEKNKSSKITDSFKEVGPYLGLGTQLAAAIVIMFFIGKWLDDTFETLPLFTIIFSFFGGFAGIYNFIKAVLNLNKKKKFDK